MRYIAILRGINVSGKNKIKMADFRLLLESNGFNQVETYIQSGNISFHSDNNKISFLEQKLHELIAASYGYDVPVLVLEGDYINEIASGHPFDEDIYLSKLHVTFLAQQPNEENIEVCNSLNYSPDIFKIQNRCVYVYCPNGYGRTKINNTFFERKLKVKATTRNWKTVQKLKGM